MNNKWISVKEKLPEFDEQVLIVWIARSGDKCRNIAISSRREIEEKWRWDGFAVLDEKVSHWMPLPELPK